MSITTNVKLTIEEKVYLAINKWLTNSDYNGKIIYKSWTDEKNATILYDNKYKVKCDLAVFVNLDSVIYRIFINFKINNFTYELNARRKALMGLRQNGLLSYDSDGKKAFKLTNKDKTAVVIFISDKITNDNMNSWKNRVLCAHSDNIVSTIKQQFSLIKEQNNKLKYKRTSKK